MAVMQLMDSPTYRQTLARRLEREKASKNDGTIPGGLAYMVDSLNAAYQRHRDEEDRTGAMQAFRAGMGEGAPVEGVGRDAQQPNAPQQQPGIDAVMSRLSGMEDNPYAGRLSMQLAMTQAEQRQAAEAAQQQFQQQLMRDQMNNEARIRASAAGRSSVNVNTGSGPQREFFGLPTLPKGYDYMRDQSGAPVVGENGAVQLIPIRGGPVEEEQAAAAAAQQEQQRQKVEGAENVLSAIGDAKRIVAGSDIPVTGMGSVISAIPGTPAHDLSNILNTIKANVGFDKLQAMRDASPTGGALGQVSENENRLLQSRIAALEQSQSQEQFLRNLERVEQTYANIIHGPPEIRNQQRNQGGDIGNGIRSMDQPPATPNTDDLLRKYGVQ